MSSLPWPGASAARSHCSCRGRRGHRWRVVTGGDGLPVDVEPFDTTYYINDVGQQGLDNIGVASAAASSSSPSRRSRLRFRRNMGEYRRGDLTQAFHQRPWGWTRPSRTASSTSRWWAWPRRGSVGRTTTVRPVGQHDSAPFNSTTTSSWPPSRGRILGTVPSAVLYDTAVRFCYNKLAGIFCYTSLGGGATFAAGGQAFGLVTTSNLHGAISSTPDGTVRAACGHADAGRLQDNGLNGKRRPWVRTLNCKPAQELRDGRRRESNGYRVWTGGKACTCPQHRFW